MRQEKGFTFEVESSYDEFWRYNVVLMCGCFDAEDTRTEFLAIESHLADVGANLAQKPADIPAGRAVSLSTSACVHAMLYLYVVPHTLPRTKGIESTTPFELKLTICYAGKQLRTQQFLINQWSGTSVEMRVDRCSE